MLEKDTIVPPANRGLLTHVLVSAVIHAATFTIAIAPMAPASPE